MYELENNMTKQQFINLANELLEAENLENRDEDLKRLKREYKYITSRDDETYHDQEETNKVIAIYNELVKKEPKLLISAADEKRAIIEKARKLLDKREINAASKELEVLSEEFRKAGRTSSKELDDELWNEFRQIKDEFYSKRRAFYEELNNSNAEKRAKKENIIERAKALVENEKNIKEATSKMDELRKEWKEVGYSGRGDEHLWNEFAKVMDDFQAKKKEHRHEMVKLFEERANKKEELIKRAKILLANSEFSKEEIEKVKGLRSEYKSIGFAGKEKEDDLYQRFNEVIQKYFEEMKFYKD